MSARARARQRDKEEEEEVGWLRSLSSSPLFVNALCKSFSTPPPLILILIIPPRFLSLAIFFDSLFSARGEGGNLERNLSTGGHFVDIGGGEEEGLDVFEV